MFKQPIGRSIAVLPLLALSSFLYSVENPTGTEAVTPGITLAECYQKALKVSETLAITEEDIRQLEARYRQGVGAALPKISWQMTQLWQDTSNVEESSAGVQGTLLRQRRPESFFQLEQPLFHGLREFNATKGITSARKSAQLKRDQAALNLLVDVADVFYTSLSLQEELTALGAQHDLITDRLKDLQRRVSLGRSRDSEVLSAQVEQASLDAQIQDSRLRWASARQTLEFLTEVPPSVPLVEKNTVQTTLTIEAAHAKAASRPDLRASTHDLEVERFQVRYAKGGYYPDVDFTGKWYTERVGFNEDVKWDALLSLEVPIFSGLVTLGQVREAQSRMRSTELEVTRLRRQVREEVETAFNTLQYTKSQTEFYSKAVELAQRNYRLQQQEYRLGLINNLQVLQVLTDLQELKIRQLQAQAAMRLSDVRLRVATGQGL